MNKKSRIIFGYILVLVGILMPLVAFTSMSYREISADSNYNDFKDKNVNMTKAIDSYNKEITKNDSNIIDPFENEEYEASYNIEGLEKDEVFAYLIIPKLDIKKPIYLDASYEHLDWGVAQIEGTSLPLGGKSTRSVIAGHRGWWGDLMFYNVDELENGDKIFIDGRTGLLEYSVVGKEIITPNEWEKILPIENKDMITLLTCHPKRPPRPQRLLINAERVVKEEPVVKEDVKEYKSSSNLKLAIYVITIIGWISFIVVGFKFIKYLINKRS